MNETRSYNSQLRQQQAEATRERILDAMAAIYEEEGRVEAATARAVAARAGVREITVYRHFPNRERLLQGLWARLNRKYGVTVGMPEDAAEVAGKMEALFQSFEAAPAHILASIRTEQGLKVRDSLNPERSAAFLKIVQDIAPRLDEPDRRKAAAVLQLLYSAYSWVSLREQWDLRGAPAAEAVAWAVETLIADLRQRGSDPIRPVAPSPAQTSDAQTGDSQKDAEE